MKPERQRIAIAEACGVPYDICMCGDGVKSYAHSTEHPFVPMADIPDYLNDLNAMHEAEGVLTEEQWPAYRARVSAKLQNMARDGSTIPRRADRLHATAAQRAEAFLKTIGKWEETP